VPWRGITVVVVLIVIAAASAWEFYCRSIGYGATLNDNEDLWTSTRRRVKPESVIIKAIRAVGTISILTNCKKD
jgi:hypothetical protein